MTSTLQRICGRASFTLLFADEPVTNHKCTLDLLKKSAAWNVKYNCCNAPAEKPRVLESIWEELETYTIGECVPLCVDDGFLKTKEGESAVFKFSQEFVMFEEKLGRGKRACRGRKTQL